MRLQIKAGKFRELILPTWKIRQPLLFEEQNKETPVNDVWIGIQMEGVEFWEKNKDCGGRGGGWIWVVSMEKWTCGKKSGQENVADCYPIILPANLIMEKLEAKPGQ